LADFRGLLSNQVRVLRRLDSRPVKITDLGCGGYRASADDASALRALIPDIAAGYPGVIGDCTLDQYGDRNVALYGVDRYEIVDGVSGWSKSDEYHMDFDEVFNREGVH